MGNSWIDEVRWNNDGLVAAIAQDHATNEILMMAWMNRESLQLTISEQRAVYWSRSRQAIWRKGESSGHTQQLKSIRLDCDADAIILAVEQSGDIACHTGRRSCFYRELDTSSDQPCWKIVAPVLKDPQDIY